MFAKQNRAQRRRGFPRAAPLTDYPRGRLQPGEGTILIVSKRLCAGIVALLVSGCAELGELARQVDLNRPSVNLTSVALSELDFEQARLRFDFAVTNDNPVSIRLAGLDYDLKIDGASLVSGRQEQRLELAARGVSPIQVPVTLRFADLERIAAGLAERERVAYALETVFRVDLGILGVQSLPVSTEGTVPVPKAPRIALEGIEIASLSLSRAELALKIGIDNPNAFGIDLGRLVYRLDVDGAHWGGGALARPGGVPARGRGRITLPLSLDLAALGAGAYQLLAQGRPLDYRLRGTLNLDTTLEMLRGIELPLDLAGRIGLR